MASDAQIEANKLNAQNSTGPNTPDGKLRSSQNARTHGLTARELVIPAADTEIFNEFQAALLAEVKPSGELEGATFKILLHAAWNLDRIRRMEVQIFEKEPNAVFNPDRRAELDHLAKYEARAERSYYRALKELKELQTNRALRRVLDVSPHAPPLLNVPQLKRSQSVRADPELAASVLHRRLQIVRRT